LEEDGIGENFLPHLGLDYYFIMEPWRLLDDVGGVGIVDESDRSY